MPILVEAVDEEDRIRAVLPELDEMVGDGLITLEGSRSQRIEVAGQPTGVNKPLTGRRIRR